MGGGGAMPLNYAVRTNTMYMYSELLMMGKTCMMSYTNSTGTCIRHSTRSKECE